MIRRAATTFLDGERVGTIPTLLRWGLVPAALLFGAGARVRLHLHARGWTRRSRLPLPVVSVGNLTLGGTGKTPFVRLIARRLLAAGAHPLVVSRGYGASAGGGLDEEGMSLLRAVPGLCVAQGADRQGVVRRVQASGRRVSCVVLDDGAQALSLHRDLEILLLDARRPFGTGWTLPAGNLREPPRGVARADLLVLTRADAASHDERRAAHAAVRRWGYKGPVLEAVHTPESLEPGTDPPSSLAGRRVHLLSGIARPDAFRRTASELGALVVGESRHPDHHPFLPRDLTRACSRGLAEGADLLLATGKDAPKLRSLPPAGLPLQFLEVGIRLLGDGSGILDRTLEAAVRSAQHETPCHPLPASHQRCEGEGGEAGTVS